MNQSTVLWRTHRGDDPTFSALPLGMGRILLRVAQFRMIMVGFDSPLFQKVSQALAPTSSRAIDESSLLHVAILDELDHLADDCFTSFPFNCVYEVGTV